MKALNYSTKMALIICGTTFISTSIMAKDPSRLIKQYKKQSRVLDRKIIQQKIQNTSVLRNKLKRYKRNLKANLAKGMNIPKAEYEFKRITSSRLSSDKKVELVKKLLFKNRNPLFTAFENTYINQNEFEKLLRNFKPNKKIILKDMGTAVYHTPSPIEKPALEDLHFTAPYPYEYTDKVGHLVHFVNTFVEKEEGETYSSVMTALDGTSYGKAGVTQNLTIPDGVSKIKVSVFLDIKNHKSSGFTLLGFAYSDTNIFLDIFNNNQMKCTKIHQMSSMVAPVAWFAESSGSGIQTLTCEARVEPGSEVLITTGTSAFSLVAVYGVAASSVDSGVEYINVEFIE